MLTVILIWRFGDHVKITKLTYAIIDPFILQAWVSLHTVMKSTNLKSCQQHFLSKLPNIVLAYISAYTVLEIYNFEGCSNRYKIDGMVNNYSNT